MNIAASVIKKISAVDYRVAAGKADALINPLGFVVFDWFVDRFRCAVSHFYRIFEVEE
jgi:hypothetical protein